MRTVPGRPQALLCKATLCSLVSDINHMTNNEAATMLMMCMVMTIMLMIMTIATDDRDDVEIDGDLARIITMMAKCESSTQDQDIQ